MPGLNSVCGSNLFSSRNRRSYSLKWKITQFMWHQFLQHVKKENTWTEMFAASGVDGEFMILTNMELLFFAFYLFSYTVAILLRPVFYWYQMDGTFCRWYVSKMIPVGRNVPLCLGGKRIYYIVCCLSVQWKAWKVIGCKITKCQKKKGYKYVCLPV